MTPDLTSSLRSLIDGELFALDDSVSDTTDLHAEGLDSLALMQLILLLEREYAVTILPEDLDRENFSTLGKLAAFIAGKKSPVP